MNVGTCLEKQPYRIHRPRLFGHRVQWGNTTNIATFTLINIGARREETHNFGAVALFSGNDQGRTLTSGA